LQETRLSRHESERAAIIIRSVLNVGQKSGDVIEGVHDL